MRLTVTVAESASARSIDVVLDAEPGSTAQEIRSALTTVVRPGGQASPLYVNGEPLPGQQPLSESPLREGALVSLGDPDACPPGEPEGLVEIRVVSGPDAGGVFRLAPGSSSIGSDSAVSAVAFDDPSVPGEAVGVQVEPDGTVRVTPKSGQSVWLDGAPLGGTRIWRRGGQLAVGWTVVELATPEPPDAAVHPSADGAALDYNRPPRLRPPPRPSHFKMPSAPQQNEKRPLPILMAVAPLVLAVVMVIVFQRYFFLAIALLSPVMVIGNYLTDKKHGRKSYNRKVGEYRQRKASLEAEARQALEAEETERRNQCLNPAAALLAASGPRSRLWEHRRDDPDYLLLRVGTGDLPSSVVLDDPSREEHHRSVTWTAADVPVSVALAERAVLGVAGPGETPRALARWVLAQCAAGHSPNDLRTYVLTDGSGRASWQWVRWLPHARPHDDPQAGVLIGTDPDAVTARISELSAVVTERRKALRDASGGARFADPDILVLLDGARRLRLQPGVIQILKEGPSVGVYAVCLDTDERTLPAECAAVVAVDPAGGLRVRQTGQLSVDNVRPECVTPPWCERLARGLAPLRDVSGEDEDAALPGSARLLEVIDLEPPTAEAIAARWNADGSTTRAVLGYGLDGPYAVDLARDGPHGLVAGTTGSGKSELLQTLVGSLAAANRPDAMQFVLVDYKGGSAFKDCVHLPHTAGMVTDLDANLVERALESISAELRRREHLLAHAGASDIDGYMKVAGANPELEPVPRLCIVIDEFAALVQELPDFVTGLVDLARRGRSLGIHLILATQRPSGVVSADIRANTDLRIALRVTDSGESADVIDAPDSGRISKATPGRGYVRLGSAPLIPFQAGRVGGQRAGVNPAAASSQPWAARLDPARLGYPPPEPPKQRIAEEEVTDLAVLVQAIGKATQALEIPDQPSPWLPALPRELLLDDLPRPRQTGALAPIPYGLEDLPADQDQAPACLDFATLGHMFAVGGPRTGRSQLLRTIAGSVGRTQSAADVHLYGIDCGNGALLAVGELPHCGAVVRNNQIERCVRLINRLGAEMTRRIEVLSEQGLADVGEQRAAAGDDQRLPHLLVLVDRWESFVSSLGELDNNILSDQLQRVLREGASVGLHLIVTGDRSLLSGRMATLTDNKLVFKLPDKSDLTMAGLNPKKVSDNLGAGRALRSESAIETQVAVLAPDISGQGQASALTRIGERAREREGPPPVAQRPFRVDALPARLGFEQAWDMRDEAVSGGSMWALVGVGGDTLTAFGPALGTGTPGFVVAGPPTSGRSTVLLTMARSLRRDGVGVVAIAPRQSPVRGLADEGVTVLTGSDVEPEELVLALADAGDDAVALMDDGELLKNCAAGDALTNLLGAGSGSGRALVVAGDSESVCQGWSGWQTTMKKARRGLLLSPQSPTEGDLIGTRLSRNVGGPIQPGRGVLHLGRNELVTVQVPTTN